MERSRSRVAITSGDSPWAASVAVASARLVDHSSVWNSIGRLRGVLGAGRRLAENAAEFLLEERPVLVRPSTVDAFAADVVRLRDDLERTAKRIARLEQRLAQSAAPTTTRVILSPDN